MDKKETIVLDVQESYSNCTKDSCNCDKQSTRKPAGYVEVYTKDGDEKELVGKHNLVVYSGREFIAQSISGTNNVSGDAINSKDYGLYWLEIGQGGTTGDPFTPLYPNNTDTQLVDRVPMRLYNGGAGQDGFLTDNDGTNYFKHRRDGDAEFVLDGDNDNKYLVVKITTTIGTDDANNPGDEYKISEAGLWSASDLTPDVPGPYYMFARVTFPSITKTTTRELIFVWYIYT